MGKIISFSNHKGGVGKTTSAVNIGAAIAETGKRVLLVDLDPQGNLSLSLGVESGPETSTGLLRTGGKAYPIRISERLDLVPSDLELSAMEAELGHRDRGTYALRNALGGARDQYDYILIDCPPSLGMLTINALAASDEVVITLQPHYLATRGLSKLMEVIQVIRGKVNQALTIRGILVTFFDSRKILHRDVVEALGERYPGLLLKAQIRENISLAEAPAQGKDVLRYAPSSKGAQDYKAAAKELISK